jgi:hypothetical protein
MADDPRGSPMQEALGPPYSLAMSNAGFCTGWAVPIKGLVHRIHRSTALRQQP